MGAISSFLNVEEPEYKSLFTRDASFFSGQTAYEGREYGIRFAIETDDCSDDSNAFMILAEYIGVGGDPQNEGSTSISMTAPVVTSSGTSIAMTAPVITDENSEGCNVMQFILPSQYDNITDIPEPLNDAVRIVELPLTRGVSHQYGWDNWDIFNLFTGSRMEDFMQQLEDDGMSSDEVDSLECQQWGFSAPFTPPPLVKNEIWCPLNNEQVEKLMN